MGIEKYKPYGQVKLEKRTWPDKVITGAPTWCSVDLRDGNQSLPVPMNGEKKLAFLKLLKKVGFKEIEIGFPSASETEFEFARQIIEEGYTDDIVVQVLTQARAHLIEKTFEALKGTKQAIVHIYNSTSVKQREVVFRKTKKEIIKIATDGAKLVKDMAKNANIADLRYEYSPESFTGTELDYALEICEAVMDELKPTKEKPLIINLPATVEMATPNIYADQVEWFLNNISDREKIILSLHAHNDRGTGIAATELAMLAGAQRVEGTLFGNGERTGNADLLTLAMNLYSQGIDPELNIENVNEIVEVYEACTGMTVHERHPYAGQLVYTAFSGSHQDAIRKGLKEYNESDSPYWEVPYLPIDPKDIGREYEAIIRINSQSGKGGVAFILEQEFGFILPKEMHPEFGKIIKEKTDLLGRELKPKEIYDIFEDTYLLQTSPYTLSRYAISSSDERVDIKAVIREGSEEMEISGSGNGPISAFFDALKQIGISKYKFETYKEHALSSGEDAEAVAYIELKDKDCAVFGVGRDKNTTRASLKAILSAVNRLTIRDLDKENVS